MLSHNLENIKLYFKYMVSLAIEIKKMQINEIIIYFLYYELIIK